MIQKNQIGMVNTYQPFVLLEESRLDKWITHIRIELVGRSKSTSELKELMKDKKNWAKCRILNSRMLSYNTKYRLLLNLASDDLDVNRLSIEKVAENFHIWTSMEYQMKYFLCTS